MRATAGAQRAQHVGAGPLGAVRQVSLAQQPLHRPEHVRLHRLRVAVAAAHALCRRRQQVQRRLRRAVAQVPALGNVRAERHA